MIRTPDQRVRVFVSSTLGELAAEREAVSAAIRQLRLTPVLFELGARPYPPRDLYRAYLKQSDVFIGIYAESYGWVAPGMEVSGLEDEYRLSAGKPRLIYTKKTARREPRLTTLLEAIRAEGVVSYRQFTDAGELGALVADDLALLLTERFGSPPAVQVLQTVSDPLLGWTTVAGRQYYVRQFRNMKGSVALDSIDGAALADYAAITGHLLAKGHARTSGASMIVGYVGSSDRLDIALARFARLYADQTEADHAALVKTADRDAVPVERGL